MLLTYVHAKVLTEGSVLFNDVLSTFYLCLYGVGHMAKNHLDSDRGNPLPALHGLLRSGQVRVFNVHIQSKLL